MNLDPLNSICWVLFPSFSPIMLQFCMKMPDLHLFSDVPYSKVGNTESIYAHVMVEGTHENSKFTHRISKKITLSECHKNCHRMPQIAGNRGLFFENFPEGGPPYPPSGRGFPSHTLPEVAFGHLSYSHSSWPPPHKNSWIRP